MFIFTLSTNNTYHDPRSSGFEDIYLPRELMHRESEVCQLSRAFKPALTGSATRNALISGFSGVGKTVLARHILNRPHLLRSYQKRQQEYRVIFFEIHHRSLTDVNDQLFNSAPGSRVHQHLQDTIE